ncbi:alpha/beta hydrolase family protein [Woeseia oceani]|nr:alpha/beta fold hydrolase [Woeseia oceani]
MSRLLCAFLALLSGNVLAEQLPYQYFGQLPVIADPHVSPDGSYVASVLNSEDGPTIVISDFGSQELNAIVKLKYGEDRIEWVRWANNERLLISVSEAESLGGSKFRVRRLYQVDRHGKGMRQVRRKSVGRPSEWDAYRSTDHVLSLLPDDPERILMQLYDERDKGYTVFKVHLEKNDFDKQFINDYDVDRWFADSKGNVVLGLEFDKDITTFWCRPEGEGKFQELHSRRSFVDETFVPIEIAGDKAMVISDHELGREAVWRYDIPSGSFEDLLFSADGYDVSDALLSTDRSRVIGVSYYEHFQKDHYFDQQAEATDQLIDNSFPGLETNVVSRSLDGKRLMIAAQRDNSPPKYIWLDLDKKTGGAWFSQYPNLEGKTLPTVQPYEFTASDGTTLQGYLTMPLAPAAEKPPLIVFPHGGPHSRDYQYFSPYVQFFANRGFAVLQVNFRGSEGFGSAFEAAGYRQWGQAMQQDVYEAVDWLTAQDIVDADRKCMVGASYGGYVALVAAYQRPHDYRCIASIAGIADLYDMVNLESLNPGRKPIVAKSIGDVGSREDVEMLREHSVIRHVIKIRAPILLVHGTVDTRVDVAQSRAFYSRASKADLDIRYLELKDGTHFLDEYNNRLAVFEALDEFLAERLQAGR